MMISLMTLFGEKTEKTDEKIILKKIMKKKKPHSILKQEKTLLRKLISLN